MFSTGLRAVTVSSLKEATLYTEGCNPTGSKGGVLNAIEVLY